MSDNDDCMQRQEIELSSVKAIYPEIIDLREGIKIKQTNRKNQRQPTWRPLEIQITIKPNTENVHVQVDLVVKCSNKYPKEPPSFELRNVVGLSNQIVQQLENELIELSKELAAKDEEGLFMFINKVEENLSLNNKPAPKSFYDQMLSNQLKQQQKEEQLKMEMILKEKQKEEELNKEIKEAIIEKQKLLENEIKKRRSSFMDNDEIIASINSLENSISNLKENYLNTSKLLKDYHLNNQTSLRSCEIDHSLIDCKFKAIIGNEELHVQRYSCELHCDQYRTDYLAIVQNRKNSTPFYLLSEWNLKLNSHKIDKNQLKEDKTKIMKELLIIRTKFEHQLQNINHQNIIQPLSFIYSLDNDLICLRLLQSHVDNIRFCDLPFVFCKFQQEIKSTPFYFIQILDALNYLHLNKLVHGNLTTENILIDLSTGHIKLINILVDVYINDFIEKTKSINDRKLLNPFLDNSKINFKLKDIELDYLNFGYLLIWFLLEFKINFKKLLLMKQSDLIKMLHEQNVVECTLELIKNCLNKNSLTIIEPLIVEYFENSLKKLNDNIDENQKRKPFNLNDDLDNEQFANNDDNLKNLPLTCKNSRLSDFVILSKLGHGGFGEVYKVKNILDQNEYALKKIKINTTNKLLNKKIKQEVRYLSALSHENVVRYFSSWIEYEFKNNQNYKIDEEISDEVDSSNFSNNDEEKDSFLDSESEELSEDEDELDARCLFSNSLRLPKDDLSDDYVVFQDSNDGDKIITDHLENNNSKNNKQIALIKKKFSTTLSPFNEIMYIQMELCEKMTLHHAITSQQLHQDNRRSRRLFRELIEALAYIHRMHIIHRDLKPGNIFLDSYDHVKIGDFGLATAYVNELIRADNQTTNNQEILAITNSSSNFNDKFSNPNQSITINNPKSEIVGTPFYLSPEITTKSKDPTAKKITYTEKVDIYSSGIIMFEMFYPAPSTGMERFKILTNLRLPEIVFPDDVNYYLTEQEKCLIKLLLNHNPKERPTSCELLESEYLPALEIEEAKQQVMIKQIIQNPRGKQHKFLLNSLFNKPMTSVDDIVYDSEIDVIKSKKLINNDQLKARVFQFVSDKLVFIFKKYGAYRFLAPQFTPTNSLNKFNLNNAFTLMDSNGTTVVPPYDLRIPFARFIARNPNLLSSNNNVSIFKRYAIDKVYRSRIIGYHPKELWEAAFDIVTQQTGVQCPIIPDVEVLLVLNEIIDSFDNLKNKPFTLRINSVKFLKAVFSYFEIDDQHFDQVLRILAESNDRNYVSKSNDSEYSKTPKDHINHMLSSKNILEPNKTQILIQMLFDNEKNNSKELIELIEFFMRIRSQPKQKQAYEQAVDAIKELGLIIDCLQNSCNTFRMKIKFVPNLVLNLSNCNIYSRLIFQLQYDIVKKHQIIHQILATGGRYDDLIQDFSVNFTSKTDPINEKALINAEQRTSVGFSLEIEKIIRCVIEDEVGTNQEERELADCDLVLYADIYDNERYRLTFKDLCQIANELRQQGLRVKVLNEKLIKLSDLNKYCFDNLIKYLFILIQANDSQQTTNNLYQLKQLTFERQKSFDRKSLNVMNCAEIIDYIKYELNFINQNYSSSPFNTNQFNMNQFSNSNAFTFESTSCSISSNYLSTNTNFSANLNTTNVKYQSIDLTAKISSTTNIRFIDIEKTFETISKKKVHQLIVSSISNKLNYLMNSKIEVLALELPFKILKLIVYESDFEKDGFGKISDSSCEENIKRCVEKCPKYKNQINELMYRILELKRKSTVPLIILVSLNDVHDFSNNFVIVP